LALRCFLQHLRRSRVSRSGTSFFAIPSQYQAIAAVASIMLYDVFTWSYRAAVVGLRLQTGSAGHQ